jgi:autotransporter-associated beta strand protein
MIVLSPTSAFSLLPKETASPQVADEALKIHCAIGGTGRLTKAGAGSLTLGGNNTYTGNTTISAGTLLINGNLTGSGDVWSLTSGNNTWTFTHSTGDLGLSVIPEPSTWALLAFSLTTVLVLRRRRRA